MTSIELRKAIRSKYAWPGGYPMFCITSDGAALCMECAKSEFRQIAYARRHEQNDGWRVTAVDINYEDTGLICDHCSKQIEAAYS
jgi:hypothetical protein